MNYILLKYGMQIAMAANMNESYQKHIQQGFVLKDYTANMQIPNPFNYHERVTEAKALSKIAGDDLTTANYQTQRSNSK